MSQRKPRRPWDGGLTETEIARLPEAVQVRIRAARLDAGELEELGWRQQGYHGNLFDRLEPGDA